MTASDRSLCPQINPVAFGALLQYLYTGEPRVWVGRGHSTPRCLSPAVQGSLSNLLGWLFPPGARLGRGTASWNSVQAAGSRSDPEPPSRAAPTPRLPGCQCGACQRL